MRSYIKAIILFNGNGEKREIILNEGVNIITGRSKTGKSALVEIIDYCLCSRRSTIPKGKITEFTHLYVLAIYIKNNTYIVARQSGENEGIMYFIKEDSSFNIQSLRLEYFDDKCPSPRSSVQYEIEKAFGLNVSNILDNNDSSRKASLRNMVSYLFQHQNLIASKFALFYRFSDYYKRKDAIEQFPIFAGIISQEYYSDLIILNDLKNRLKNELKKQKESEKRSQYVKENLQNLLRNYFALLNMPNDHLKENLSINALKKIALDLPTFNCLEDSSSEEIANRYKELKNHLEDLRNQETVLISKINNLNEYSNNGESFTSMLNALNEKTLASPITIQDYECPLCGKKRIDLKEVDEKIIQSSKWLRDEMEITKNYTSSFFEEIRSLEKKKREVVSEIKKTARKIKEIEDEYLNSNNLKTKQDQINSAKAKIDIFTDMVDKDIFIDNNEDIRELENNIKIFEEKIKRFDVESKKINAQNFLNSNMNRLAKGLDFEEEYKPINLNFGLLDSSFGIYQQNANTEKIYLDEMGSGANWVSCHLALFLSLLHYFSKQEKSPMPLIMFFDQPSQVYFPQGDSNRPSADITAVNLMYKTIFDEIKAIENEVGFLPQLIIVDHVDGNDLNISKEFNTYVRYNWLEDGALI